MPEWHEQKTRIADNRENRSAQQCEQNSTAPPNTIQIPDAGSHHNWQKYKSRPEVTVNSDICWEKSDIESVAHSGKSSRPEYGCHNAANYTNSSWVRPTL